MLKIDRVVCVKNEPYLKMKQSTEPDKVIETIIFAIETTNCPLLFIRNTMAYCLQLIQNH